MSKLKKGLISLLFVLAFVIILPNASQAASTTKLEEDIKETLNTALDEYLTTVDARSMVEQIVNDTLNTFVDTISKSELKTEIEETVNTAVRKHLEDLQTALEDSMENSTYQYSVNVLNAYINNYILSNLDQKITNYNNNTKSKYRHRVLVNPKENIYRWEYDREYYNGKWIYTYEKHIITDHQRAQIKSQIIEQINIDINDYISTRLFSNTASQFFLGSTITSYISNDIMKYTNVQNILDSIRNDVKVQASNEVTEILATTIEEYIASDSGEAVFTGIKDAVYYYIQENGGLDKILETGFGDDLAEYIGSKIGEIVKASIQYSLSPYVLELSETTLKSVTEKATQDYVNGGTWNLIVRAITNNVNDLLDGTGQAVMVETTDQNGNPIKSNVLMDGSGGQVVLNNLTTFLDEYLVNNTNMVNIINSNLKSSDIEIHVTNYWIESGYGENQTVHKNTYYNDVNTIGEVVLKQTRAEAKQYMTNNIHPKIINEGKSLMNSYLSGEGGKMIRTTLVNDLNMLFVDKVINPLLEQININIAKWISEGLGEKMITAVRLKVEEYVSQFKDPEDFADATGMKLGEIIREVRYDTGPSYSRKISLEELIASNTLVSADRGAVLVPKKDDYNPLDDATVEIGSLFPIQEYVPDTSTYMLTNPIWAMTTQIASWPNPYASTIGIGRFQVGPAGLSRTIAEYTTTGIKNLEPEEAYVLAHTKNTQYYPDRVQTAYWQILQEVRGLKFEYDEGLIDKEDYESFMRAFGLVSGLLKIEWKEVFDSINEAKELLQSGKLLEGAKKVLSSIDSRIIALALNTAGITLADIFPFIDPDIFEFLSYIGIGLDDLIDVVKVGISGVVDFVENGIIAPITAIKDRVVAVGTAFGDMISEPSVKNFLGILDAIAGNVDGKRLTTVWEELMKKVDEGFTGTFQAVFKIMSEVSASFGLEVFGVSLSSVLNLAGMSWDEFMSNFSKENVFEVYEDFLTSDNIESAAPAGLLNLLNDYLYYPNEMTEEHQMEDPVAGYEIYEEAIFLGEALDKWNAFEKENGAVLVDRTDYSMVKVSYSKLTDDILVGPFYIDYIREFYSPISLYDSEMADEETGIVSYTGIVEAKLYADDAKTVEVKNWEFVYPDERISLPYEDSMYEYPYPNEEFYLKFPSDTNYSINTLSKMTFKMAKMDADGQTYELKGTYDQLIWITTGIPIPCVLIGRCKEGVPFGHPLTPTGWCPPIYCPIHSAQSLGLFEELQKEVKKIGETWDSFARIFTNEKVNETLEKAATAATQEGAGKAVIETATPIPGAGDRKDAVESAVAATTAKDAAKIPPARPFTHVGGNFYFCFRVVVGTDDSQNLEEMIYSKVYREYQTVTIEMGEVQTYYNNDVNTTDIMYPSEAQGNISIETSEVPQLPFLPNYDTYPGWEGYPYYEDNPNYPDNPYSFDNPLYDDYPSWPYYLGDPTYPYYPNNPVIPLTFHIEGTVWLDNPGGTEAEANGILEGNERGIPNVEVILYKVDDPNYIAKTLTNEDGHYIFEWIRVGYDYYVEFVYDGITYRTTKYIEQDYEEYTGVEDVEIANETYRENPSGYLESSHAIEDEIERDIFNEKFYHISQNLATGVDGSTIELEYQTWYTDNGAVSTVITTDKRGITKDEFKMYARTMNTNLYFPLHDQYQVDYNDLDFFRDGYDYYICTYPGLEHINLGLIKREQGDMTVKTDLYQIITHTKNDVQRYKFDEKGTDPDTYDILYREGDYYTANPYNQELDPNDHAYRTDVTYGDYADIVREVLTDDDELNVYMEYKILIQNNATLQSGRVIVLENSYDKDLEYATAYIDYDMTSWIEIPMNGEEEGQRIPITWHYREGTENGYTTIYTTDLAEKNIAPGEVVELHLMLKVKKDAYRNIILDNGDVNVRDDDPDLNDPNDQDVTTDDFKESISEIHTYSYNEGLIDKSSNPGSAKLGEVRTYPDSADPAPLSKLIYDLDYSIENSNTIEGYVWEDLVTDMLPNNNQLLSNGLRDKNEKLINNVKVELVEVIRNDETGKEIEVLRRTASGTSYYRTGEDIKIGDEVIKIEDGQYKFPGLETGVYRVKFTYGDEVQLSKDITYNAQDYKSVSLDTTIQQYKNKNLEVMILTDTSQGMQTNDKDEKIRDATPILIDTLYEKVQKIKVGGILFSEPTGSNDSSYMELKEKPDKNLLKQLFKQDVQNVGGTLDKAIEQALSTFSPRADAKVIVILTDGYMENVNADKEALKAAEKAGVKVITVACSVDEWDKATFGTEEDPTAGNLYNIRELNIKQYITEMVVEDVLLEFEKVLPNLTDAKDVENKYDMPDGSKVGDIFSRKRNIDYSSTMTNENAEVLDVDSIINLQKQVNKSSGTEKAELTAQLNERIKALADATKVTAVTPNRNIVFSHDNARTQEVNLGIVERPKLEVKIEEHVERIVITLANGEVLIDTAKNLTQNVQVIKDNMYSIYVEEKVMQDKMYSIYMDEEIMQGARIDVYYKITIVNNGQVDTLADYFTYDMFAPKEEVDYWTRTVPIKIGTLNDYYSNLTFRAEENTNLEVETNKVTMTDLQFNGTVLQNWQKLVKNGKTSTPSSLSSTTKVNGDGRASVLNETVTWVDRAMINLHEDADAKIDNDKVKVIETTSLNKTELFPNMSKEVLREKNPEASSITLYLKFSKNISANDQEDSLTYKNSIEIVERLSDVGRRDYIAVTGNYVPNTEDITEYDSDMAENIVILPPFGENNAHYYLLAFTAIVIIIGGVAFIKRKIL